MISFHRFSGRSVTPSQRRAVRNVLRFYRKRYNYNGVTSVRLEMSRGGSDTTEYFWLTVRTRRSDCGRDSLLALLSECHARILIGPRGGITVYDAREGYGPGSDSKRHVAYMLGAKTRR